VRSDTLAKERDQKERHEREETKERPGVQSHPMARSDEPCPTRELAGFPEVIRRDAHHPVRLMRDVLRCVRASPVRRSNYSPARTTVHIHETLDSSLR